MWVERVFTAPGEGIYGPHFRDPPNDWGSGRSLPPTLLLLCTSATLFTTVVSSYSIIVQLKHYYKPRLQRYVVRILIIGNDRLDARLAFVIYCFFNLLVEYLSGEGAILNMLRGRPPTPHIFPISLVCAPMDLSDPYTFLSLKRGILQYVQIKPILAVATVLLKIYGKYQDGHLHVSNGYTWIAMVYNISVFVALYALTIFWVCLKHELAPFHVGAKFVCVKGVIFFSFWQGLTISILVATGLITKIGGVMGDTHLSTALQDTLICMEMPLFALAHLYAFSYKDYVEPPERLAGRMPFLYALRDSFGAGDIFWDTMSTIHGTGYSYHMYEPCHDNVVHHASAYTRRSRAGLRYAHGGRSKYWVDQRRNKTDEETPLVRDTASQSQYVNVQSHHPDEETSPWIKDFEEDERLYKLSRKLVFGDYRYPCIGPA